MRKPKLTKSEIDKNLNRACRAYIIPKGLAKLCTRANARCVTADCLEMIGFDASRSSAEELTQVLSCLVVWAAVLLAVVREPARK